MTQERPDVLWLLSDEHTFRHVGHLGPGAGGEPVHTPALDRLAGSGTVFESTYCQSPVCTPSRICMLTGRAVTRSGGWRNGSVLKPGLATLPGAFSDAGYETCLVGKMHLGGDRQFCGFDHRPYGDLTGLAGHQGDPPTPSRTRGLMEMRSRIADAGVTGIPESLLQEYNVVRESVSFVREHTHSNSGRPWFLCASFSRPHFPYTAPERHVDRYWPDDAPPPKVGPEGDADDHPSILASRERLQLDEFDDSDLRRARAAYFACVDFLDEIVGDLLGALARDGLLDDTIVVYTSDHGDMAGEHGLFQKQVWYDASTRVPWIVQLPDQRDDDRASARVTTPVSLSDLFPTLCGLADIDAPEGLDGVDLSEAVRTGAEPDRGPVFCDLLYPLGGVEGTEYRLIRDGRYKYVGFRDAPELLFDLADDPLERRNLAPDATGEDREALEHLRGLVDRTIDFDAAEERRREDEPLMRERSLPIPFGENFISQIGETDSDLVTDRARVGNAGGVNAYQLPDGRIVEGDTPLYQPHVIAEDPSRVFDDWPER